MSVIDPGVGVWEIVRSAKYRIFIVAPFIKSHTLKKLICEKPEGVSELICVTRWLPEDIASGVCDIEIFDQLAECEGVLYVNPNLHAKIYSNESQFLVGSANLTDRALGFYSPSNVELLVALSADFPGLEEWINTLLESSVRATKELRDRISLSANKLKSSHSFYFPHEVEETNGQSIGVWIPTCTTPDKLWLIYQGHGEESTVTSAYEAAIQDLAVLTPPQELDEALFRVFIESTLRQMPIFREIDQLAATGITDSKAQEFIRYRLNIDNDTAKHNWEVLKRWFGEFFPDSYRLETGQDILIKGKVLSPR